VRRRRCWSYAGRWSRPPPRWPPAGNEILRAVVDGLSGTTTRARLWRGPALPEAVAAARHDHRAIADAIAARSPELAQAWATVHLAQT